MRDVYVTRFTQVERELRSPAGHIRAQNRRRRSQAYRPPCLPMLSDVCFVSPRPSRPLQKRIDFDPFIGLKEIQIDWDIYYLSQMI